MQVSKHLQGRRAKTSIGRFASLMKLYAQTWSVITHANDDVESTHILLVENRSSTRVVHA